MYFEHRRAVAPSYGFDIMPVLTHCRRAQVQAVIRDLLLCFGLVLTVRAGALATLAVVTFLLLWALVLAVAWLTRHLAGVNADRPIGPRTRTVAAVLGFAALLTWFLASGFGSIADLLWSLSEQLRLAGNTPDVWFGIGPLDSVYYSAVATLILFLLMVVAGEFWLRQLAFKQIAEGNTWTTSSRLRPFSERQAGNVTTYSGYFPFVGAGEELRTWSFALRLARTREPAWFRESTEPAADNPDEYEKPPFGVHELLDHLRAQLGTLAHGTEPGTVLPGLTIRDHVFQASEGATSLVHTMKPFEVGAIVADPTTAARHYLVCQVRSWDGEVVTTVFVHVALQGRTLYLEFSAWMLPPTRPEYQLLRWRSGGWAGAQLDSLGEALVSLPRLVLRAPLGAVEAVRDGIRATLGRLLRVSTTGYDFGARVSVRELAAVRQEDLRPHRDRGIYITDNYFQSRDVVKYWKILERRLLAAALDFLSDHDIDTAEYTERAVTVLNSGVMQFGGRMNIRDSSIGTDRPLPKKDRK